MPLSATPPQNRNSIERVIEDEVLFPSIEIPAVAFELRGNGDAKHFQDANVGSAGDPWFNEMSASMMLPINKHFEFGASFGQEVFTQVFERREIDGQLIEYQQKPRLFWGGITGRVYPITERDAMFAPFTQLTVGFNFFGSVIKTVRRIKVHPGPKPHESVRRCGILTSVVLAGPQHV